METEAPSAGSRPRRPRTSLLVLLGVAVVVFAAAMLLSQPDTPSAPAGRSPAASNQPRTTTQGQRGEQPIDPSQLAVNLEALEAPRPAPGDSERNPFRFRPTPPPTPPPDPTPQRPVDTPVGPPPPPPPPPVPPIPLKFIGIIDSPEVGRKIAAFSDCRSQYRAAEGEIIAGQYRLVKLGVESAVVEYVNGKGRTTLRMGGQECVGK